MAFLKTNLRGNLVRISNNPTVQSCVADYYTVFGQNFLKFAIGNGVAHAEEDHMNDDTIVKMRPFEIDGHLPHVFDHA